jgi:hypothetical protein
MLEGQWRDNSESPHNVFKLAISLVRCTEARVGKTGAPDFLWQRSAKM